ncbi:MAG: FAD-dependent oxidoreductase [Hydrogenophilus sp.]|nr:FAD-dependent oxidoreductase [Hydrogenophilus sp.]
MIQTKPEKINIVVIGGGVIGITTAWALAYRGHRVTVIEADSEIATGACYANGGQISVSHPHPWSSPAAPLIALRSLIDHNAPFRWKLKCDCTEAAWLAAFLWESHPQRHRRNAAAIAALARFSLKTLRSWRTALNLSYDADQNGILHLFFTKTSWRLAEAHRRDLEAFGIPAIPLTPTQTVERDPALAPIAKQLVGALYAPEDEVGDARAFTSALAARCREAGVLFRTSTVAVGWTSRSPQCDTPLLLVHPNGKILPLSSAQPCRASRLPSPLDPEPLPADLYIIAAGGGSPALAAPFLSRALIHPVKGYSLTLPILDAARIPRCSITDESRRIVASRLGTRWRIAGIADLAGWDTSISEERLRSLYLWGKNLVGDAVDWQRTERWAGLRPMRPSGIPLIGKTRAPNVWINSGHGSLGWTLACGSAELLAALICDQSPPILFPTIS